MVDPKFGTKRVCEACGGKFYDLNKNPVVCPLCGHSFDPSVASAQRHMIRTQISCSNPSLSGSSIGTEVINL